MIEFERHIEILLLSNDCVIVPNLGGFMAHHIEARFDEEERMFLPPLRTLGFNPQLKLNDSLLVQSYVECYDISYPEALRRIEDEVAELRQHLETEGSYELNDLGVLSLTYDGRLEFEPCEAGILTPELYGLSSFEMPMLSKYEKKQQKKQKQKDEQKPNAILTTSELPLAGHDEQASDEAEEAEHAITIKMSWIRNVAAVAAAIIAYFVLSTPIDNSQLQPNVTVSKTNLTMIPTDTSIKVARIDSQAVKHAIEHRDSVRSAEQQATPAAAPADAWIIVLASQVTKKNANDFVDRLHKAGVSDARIYIRNNIVRVICGNYATQHAAYAGLGKVRQTGLVDDPWVMKTKN